jgi:hypothetical protein
MTRAGCRREPEVLAAAFGGQWPDAAPDDVRDHVRACAVCADIAAVVGPLRREGARARREAHVPPARVVWWRAQIRARAAAQRTVARPMTFAGAVAAVSLAVVAAAWLPAAGAWAGPRRPGVAWWWSLVERLALPGSAEAGPALLAVIGLGLACLVLIPITLYFALTDD